MGVTVGLADFNYRSGKKIALDDEVGLISNQVDIPFYIPKLGRYCVSMRVLAEDDYSNSLYIGINLAPTKVWHFTSLSENWQWAEDPTPYNLPTGLNVIRFGERENTPLAKVKMESCS